MIACPNCTAKFQSAAEIERQWLEAHFARVHEVTRARAPFYSSLDTHRAA